MNCINKPQGPINETLILDVANNVIPEKTARLRDGYNTVNSEAGELTNMSI